MRQHPRWSGHKKEIENLRYKRRRVTRLKAVDEKSTSCTDQIRDFTGTRLQQVIALAFPDYFSTVDEPRRNTGHFSELVVGNH